MYILSGVVKVWDQECLAHPTLTLSDQTRPYFLQKKQTNLCQKKQVITKIHSGSIKQYYTTKKSPKKGFHSKKILSKKDFLLTKKTVSINEALQYNV